MFDRLVEEVGYQEVEGPKDGHVDKAVDAYNGVSGQHRIEHLLCGWIADARAEGVHNTFKALQSFEGKQLGAHQHAFKAGQGQEQERHHCEAQGPLFGPT